MKRTYTYTIAMLDAANDFDQETFTLASVKAIRLSMAIREEYGKLSIGDLHKIADMTLEKAAELQAG